MKTEHEGSEVLPEAELEVLLDLAGVEYDRQRRVPLRWTMKPAARISSELADIGLRLPVKDVAKALGRHGVIYLGALASGGEDISKRLRFINEKFEEFERRGDPVISVRKEIMEIGVGWRSKTRRRISPRSPWQDRDEPAAVPLYGIFDLIGESGRLLLGARHGTPAFAVDAVRRWWLAAGCHQYSDPAALLILADDGGANGSRVRAWHFELASLSVDSGMEITVCHLPTGIWTWGSSAHRSFWDLAKGWRGNRSADRESLFGELMRGVSESGLDISAEIDATAYSPRVRISDSQLNDLPILPGRAGDWHYTLLPRPHRRCGPPAVPDADKVSPKASWLIHPELIGMEIREWEILAKRFCALYDQEHEAALELRRRGPRQKTPAAGRYTGGRPKVTTVDQLLAAVIHERLGVPQANLAAVFGITTNRLTVSISRTRRLLGKLNHVIPKNDIRIRDVQSLQEFREECEKGGRADRPDAPEE
ncbi:hypothetical protein [Kitasatospora sp. NPDC059827]|uniref:ISAzo13-like element transposase-related protein n=1 Tax=Kitasatospora sp. NPDC059827 TaxID=3346964 RepID=UPI00364F3B6F